MWNYLLPAFPSTSLSGATSVISGCGTEVSGNGEETRGAKRYTTCTLHLFVCGEHAEVSWIPKHSAQYFYPWDMLGEDTWHPGPQEHTELGKEPTLWAVCHLDLEGIPNQAPPHQTAGLLFAPTLCLHTVRLPLLNILMTALQVWVRKI